MSGVPTDGSAKTNDPLVVPDISIVTGSKPLSKAVIDQAPADATDEEASLTIGVSRFAFRALTS